MAAVFTATYTTTGMCMCMRTSRHALFSMRSQFTS